MAHPVVTIEAATLKEFTAAALAHITDAPPAGAVGAPNEYTVLRTPGLAAVQVGLSGPYSGSIMPGDMPPGSDYFHTYSGTRTVECGAWINRHPNRRGELHHAVTLVCRRAATLEKERAAHAAKNERDLANA